MKSILQKVVLLVCTTVFFAAATGCGGADTDTTQPPGPGNTKSLSLVSFQTCAELETEVKEIMLGEVESNAEGYRYWCRYDGYGEPVAAPEDLQGGSDAASEADDRAEATGTNLQEAGVDEADLLKTDGQYAYGVVGDAVKVVRVWPFENFGLVATIEPEETPKGLYLNDTMLIILSEKSTYTYGGGVEPVPVVADDGYAYNGQMTSIVWQEVYDVSNPQTPLLIKKQSFNGQLLSSRRIDGKLYLVLSEQGVAYPTLDYDLDIDYQDLPLCTGSFEPQPNQALLAAIERLKEKNRAIIEGLSLDDLLPSVGEGKEISCSQVMRSEAATGMQLLVVVADTFADEGAAPSASAILGSGGAVYASPQALYVASTYMAYGWWQWLDAEFWDSTVIHRFGLEGGDPLYSGSGLVEGHLVNNSYAGSRYSTRFTMDQFAMSEYEGHLRVATTAQSTTSGVDGDVAFATSTLDNRVHILNTEGATMEKVGEIEGLAEGEQIYAVRFLGPRGYIVTFKKVDPLFVLDLSAPAAPKVVGELKVPGFSTYLHPWGEGQFIGLGFGGDDMGDFAWTQGLKLALFDVSNPAAPYEVGHREIGTRGSYSAAIEEHHAFTLDVGRQMLALPVEIYEGGSGGSDFGTFAFEGVMIFDVNEEGTFDSVGTIEMEDKNGGSEPYGWYDATTNILRTSILGDDVDVGIITLATYGIALHRIDAGMTEVGWVK